MPVDPQIPLATQTPQLYDLVGNFGRIEALKSALQGQQVQQAQLAGLQMENQQRQMDLEDQQKVRQAFAGWNGKNPDDLMGAIRQSGVQPKTMLGLQTSLLDMQTKAANLNKDEQAIALTNRKTLQSEFAPLLNEPNAERQAQLWESKRQEMMAQGGQIGQLAGQMPYPGSAEAAKARVAGLNLETWTLSQQQQATADQCNAAAAESNTKQADQLYQNAVSALATAPPKNIDDYVTQVGTLRPDVAKRVFSTVPPSQYDAAQAPALLRRSTLTGEQQTQADQAAANLAIRRQEVGIQQFNAGVSADHLRLSQAEFQQKYGDALGGLSGANLAIAQKLASGDFNPAQLGRIPGKEAIMAGAIAINPAWTPQLYATKQDYTDPKGKNAQNLATISRIVGHIGRYETNSKNLGWAPAFSLGTNLGGTAAALGEDAHALSGELEKLVSGGVGSEGQIKQWQTDLRSAYPKVRQQAVDEVSQLIGSQYEGMQQTYKAGTGMDLPVAKYVSPAGQQWLRTKGIDVGGAAAAANPAQTTPAPVSAAPGANAAPAAPAFKVGDTVTYQGKQHKVLAIKPDGKLVLDGNN
jgi:hypothetical protein